jgi:hypothetical protein
MKTMLIGTLTALTVTTANAAEDYEVSANRWLPYCK